MIILNILQTEFIRSRRTVMLKVFLSVPLVLVFATVFMIRTAGAESPETVYHTGISLSFTLLAMVTPLIAGLFAGMMGEQEFDAGNFRVMRNNSSRKLHFGMKNIYFILIIFLLFVVSWILVSVGIKIVYQPVDMDVWFAFQALLVFTAGALFWVPVSLYIGFRYGLGAAVSLGIFGTFFVSYLTSVPLLSERVWRFIPFAWSVKLSAAYYNYYNPLYSGVNIPLDLVIQLVSFVLVFSLLVFWFGRWEGRT